MRERDTVSERDRKRDKLSRRKEERSEIDVLFKLETIPFHIYTGEQIFVSI